MRMGPKWMAAVFCFFLLGWAAWGQDYEFVFSQVDAGGGNHTSTDYQMKDAVFFTDVAPDIQSSADYNLTSLEAYKPSTNSVSRMWFLY